MQDLPVIDRRTYENLKAAMGSGFMVELVAAFGMETPELIASLRRAQAAGNVDGFRRLAHSIKSSSNSLGALELGQLAYQLELLGRAGSLAGASTWMELLPASFDLAWQALKELSGG